MRIGLNLLPVVPGVGGSWNYIASLLAALAAEDRENEYVAFVTEASHALVPRQANFQIVNLPLRARWRALRVVFENSVFRFYAGRAKLDCMHHFFGSLPLFSHGPNVVTMYDLMVFERPRDFSRRKRIYLQRMERRAASRATVMLPMSRSTGEHLHRLLGVPWERMLVVPTPVSAIFGRADDERVARFRAVYALPPEFWVAVSGALPHKNYERLLEAFGAVRREQPSGWPLVIRADPTDVVRAMIARAGVERHVIVLPRLAEDEMPVLYSAASALVFPSLFEGGGIPVMEAMACGLPVVASDIPTTREFAGAASLRFDPTSVDAIATAMRTCERDSTMRTELTRAGLAAARRFDPTAIARACLAAYNKAVAGRSRD